MINQLNLGDIRSFVLIARYGSFAKAAELQQVSTSHVSRQLNHLEKTLGVTLMNRTTRVQQLTEAGKNLLIECEAALDRIDQATQETMRENNVLQGNIRINCVGGYFGEKVIAPLIAEFLLQYPDITADLDFSSHRVDLLADRFDLVFRMGAIPDGDFIAKPLGEIDVLTLASPDYLNTHGTPQHPQDLATKSHCCITGSVTTWGYQRESHPKKMIEVQVNTVLACKNGRVMRQSALAGLGIIRVPAVSCQTYINSGQLIPILNDWQIPTVTFSLLYRQDKFRPTRIRAFIEFVEKRGGSLTTV